MPCYSDLSPEIRLVLCCARREADADTLATAISILAGDLDWLLVVRYALEHKVLPLLCRGLRACGPGRVADDLMEQLRLYQETRTAGNLQRTQSLLEVLAALAAAGIPAIPYKGPVLALCAYGDLRLREFADIDLLIPEATLADARTLFASLGFSEVRKRLTWETSFRRGSLDVDIHWRIAPSGMFDYWIGFDLDLEGAFARSRPIRLLDTEVPGFAPEDALLVHCQTSLKNGFNRSLAQLRWLCDLNELIRSQPDLDWDVLFARATACHSRRALLVCVGLAHDLLDAPVPASVLQRARKGSSVVFLQRRLARHYLAADAWRPVAAAEQHLYAALVKDRLRDRYPYLARAVAALFQPNECDRGVIKLPGVLAPLYYLVRPLRLVFSGLRMVTGGGRGRSG